MTCIGLESTEAITGIDCSGGPGPCTIQIGDTQKRAYMKVTHRLDPIQWIRGKYSLPGNAVAPKHKKTWKTTSKKLSDPWNQAYIDTIASYAVSRLRKAGLSPHFNEFYSAFTASANTYSYNLTDDFDSYRHDRWFWNGRKRGLYSLKVVSEDASEIPEEVLNDIFTELCDGSDGSEGSEAKGLSDAEELSDAEGLSDAEEGDAEEGSDTLSVAEEEVAPSLTVGAVEEASLHSDAMSSVSFATDEDEYSFKILCEIKNFPVMMILTEESRGTMDALLDNFLEVGANPGTPEWELRWSAWIFQIIAALSVLQATLGLTHNDLHTNNIVWTPTEEEYLYYSRRDGTAFKVPTFGKLFRIIDFGRAIFTFNGHMFISDDFRTDNDAGGQYRFKPLYKEVRNPIPPNPSFDLCRLAVSLFEALFPEKPADSIGILSSERDIEMTFSVSPLYNVLWKWMIDDNGENVLVNPDGSERYPDFYLYKHIAAYIHGAVPSRQFVDPAFDRFQVNPSDVGKTWPLFC
jgi:hypothetical protein